MRCVILPSIPTSAFIETHEVTLRVRHATLEDVVQASKDCDIIVNYIRHHPTNQILSKYVQFVTGTEYKLDKNDRIFVIGLRARAPVSGQDIQVTINDLLILAVDIL